MLTKRQNFLETIHGGNPDRFVNGYEYLGLVMGSPFGNRNPNPKYGEENIVNAWGITKSWPIGTPGPFPVHKPDTIVIKDIENWRDYVKVPNVVYPAEEWSPLSPRRRPLTARSSTSPRISPPACSSSATTCWRFRTA